MAINVADPFAAVAGETCSYSAAFQAAHVVKPEGMSEAQWQYNKIKGEAGALAGKVLKGDIDLGVVWQGEEELLEIVQSGAKKTIMFKSKTGHLHEAFLEDDPDYLASIIQANEMKKVGSPPPAVSAASESLGHMTDEDMSILFVKTKDTAAELKGINIKAASPHIDDEVYDAIAKTTGYTSDEVKAKVAQYKASGKKLSVLKKKVMKDDKVYQDVVAKAKQKTAGGVVNKPLEPKVSVPESVPTVASSAAEKQAVGHVAESVAKQEYDDADLVKAYIKAKDELAADPNNSFNLYSKGPAFDHALEKKYAEWGLNVKADQVDKAVAKYVGSGKKVSALKKKMVSSGEMQAKAPSLKTPKTPVEKATEQIHAMPLTTSEKVAANQINEAVDISDSFDQFVVPEIADEKIFGELKGMVANYKSIDQNLQYFYDNAKKNNLSLSYIVKAYDKKKAAQLGVENSNFYEKKLLDYLSTPAGKQKALSLGKPPTYAGSGYTPPALKPVADPHVYSTPLGPDSDAFTTLSEAEAQAMQDGLEPWNAAQKEALKKYTGSSYSDINTQLRTGSGSTQDRAIQQMDKGMRDLPKDILVHRGTSYAQFGSNSIEELEAMVGGTIKDNGYLSTGVGGSGYGRQVQMEIEAPKGTRGAYVQKISHFANEKELVLGRGTEMRVLSVDRTEGGVRVRLRVVSQDRDEYRAARIGDVADRVTPLSQEEKTMLSSWGFYPSDPKYPKSHEDLVKNILEAYN